MITIINFGMGNIGSIANMIKRIGYRSEITSDISQIELAEKIILPGVGRFDKAIQNLKSLDLYDLIKKKAIKDKTPILGICLGMQIMCNKSEEGKEPGLGLVDAEVRKLTLSENSKIKIPHMGWNLIEQKKKIHYLRE